jgi:putative acetyltransferase
MKKLDRYE